ncbi:hypothetical protein ACIRF8_15750 [Streptomyces sp. NPDC102406]|uniref:hypothetical protein n=1 Tax=Streptomyces sp. NPDC102406 TaxID=3366171 RepID=UPI0037F5E93A
MATQHLPRTGGLTEDQLRGRACVWCGDHLDNATAVDLGPQILTQLGHQAHWFPRACPAHEEGAAS